jgi:hypothetical protein
MPFGSKEGRVKEQKEKRKERVEEGKEGVKGVNGLVLIHHHQSSTKSITTIAAPFR